MVQIIVSTSCPRLIVRKRRLWRCKRVVSCSDTISISNGDPTHVRWEILGECLHCGCHVKQDVRNGCTFLVLAQDETHSAPETLQHLLVQMVRFFFRIGINCIQHCTGLLHCTQKRMKDTKAMFAALSPDVHETNNTV